MVYHPAWGYFCRPTGSANWPWSTRARSPSPAVGRVDRNGPQIGNQDDFRSAQFSDRAAGAIARAVGGRVVPADPLAPDWAANLIRAAELFTKEAR